MHDSIGIQWNYKWKYIFHFKKTSLLSQFRITHHPRNKQKPSPFSKLEFRPRKKMSPTHDVFTGLTLRKEAWLCWAPHSYAQWNTTPSFCHRTETGDEFERSESWSLASQKIGVGWVWACGLKNIISMLVTWLHITLFNMPCNVYKNLHFVGWCWW